MPDTEWIGMTDRQRLIGLFDLAYITSVDVVLWEHDEPDAPAALQAWADANEIRTSAKPVNIGASDRTIDVQKPAGRRGQITVYCKREQKMEAA